MEKNKQSENERALRIAYRIDDCHTILANVYDNLVDREFNLVQKDVQYLISELRCIYKAIEEDDF
jgi:uncharacterized protein (UPF0297 family)